MVGSSTDGFTISFKKDLFFQRGLQSFASANDYIIYSGFDSGGGMAEIITSVTVSVEKSFPATVVMSDIKIYDVL